MLQYNDLLSQFISFKSVSTDAKFKPEIEKTVNWLEKLLHDNGFTVELWRSGKINPVVFASYTLPKSTKSTETVLVYGHYDVQPAELEDGWKADPFILREDKNKFYGRGVIDNKGQILIHIFTVLELIKEGKLNYNVKFLIEGDEETGEKELSELIKENKEKLKTDSVIVSDGEIAGDVPVIECSLRGGFNTTVTFKTANNNLHSGIYGSAAPNAAHELSKFLACLYDENNRCVIPHFYDDVDPITPEQIENGQKLMEVAEEALKATGIKKWLMEEGYDFYTQTGLRPALQVTGIKSGYISEGYANIVPSTAEARINFRIVASQDEQKVLKYFKAYVAEVVPSYVDVEISVHGIHPPVKIDITHERVGKVKELLTTSHGKVPLVKHVGGAIPVVSDFKEILGVDTLLVPLCNDDCNMHGVEENFSKNLLEKGLKFSREFFS